MGAFTARSLPIAFVLLLSAIEFPHGTAALRGSDEPEQEFVNQYSHHFPVQHVRR